MALRPARLSDKLGFVEQTEIESVGDDALHRPATLSDKLGFGEQIIIELVGDDAYHRHHFVMPN